jgi:transposase InsO family protein
VAAAHARRRSSASRPAATSGPAPAIYCTLIGQHSPVLPSPVTPSPATGPARPHKRRKLGYDVVHAIVDDHSRFAYAEVLGDAKAKTVTGFCERALAAFAAQGIEARRLMSDNAWSYVKNRSLRELLTSQGIRHLTIKPRRPRTNGKVERFIQTLEREWAYGLVYASSDHRRRALPHWLNHYNHGRPHSSLGGQPPISRVQNVCGQDT